MRNALLHRTKRTRPALAFAAAMIFGTATRPASAENVFFEYGTLGGDFAAARGINDSGQIVGYSTTAENYEHAFLYRGGEMLDLGTLGGGYSEAFAISNAGHIIGWSGTSDGGLHGFIYFDGVMTDIGTLGGSVSLPHAVNDLGQVVGTSNMEDDFTQHAFLYSDGVIIDLGTFGGSFSEAIAINNAGQVVGSAMVEGDTAGHPFLYTDGTMLDLGTLGGTDGGAADINDAGQVVGNSSLEGNEDIHAFLYSDGVMTDLGTPCGTMSLAYDINNSGQITGHSPCPTWDESRGFLYSDGVLMDLGTPYTQPWVINDSGQITGFIDLGLPTGHGFVYSDGVVNPVPGGDGRDINATGQLLFGQFFTPCPPLPAKTCVPAASALVRVKDSVNDRMDAIKWKWRGGPISQADFGTPSSDTSVRLCLYDSVGGLHAFAARLQVDPSASWINESPEGWRYSDSTGTESGVRKMRLRAGASGTARLQLVARGENISMPTPFSTSQIFDQDGRVTAQLFTDATPRCWTSEFTTAILNTASRFKAQTP